MSKFNFHDGFLLLLLVILLLAKDSTLVDPGVGWHLKNGEQVVSNLEVPTRDSFVYSVEPLFWVSDQWAADVVLFLVLSFGGFSLLHFVCSILQIAAYGLVNGRAVVREAPNRIAAFFVLIGVCANGSVQWFCRPVLFSFLFFAIFYNWMRAFSQAPLPSRKQLLHLHAKVFLLFIVWANFHPGFAISAVIFASSIFEIIFLRSSHQKIKTVLIFSLAGAALLGTLVNPYGIELHRSIVSLVSSDYFMNLNAEWLPSKIGEKEFTLFYISCAFVILFLLLASFRSLRHFDFLAVSLLLVCAILQRRYIPFFAIPLGLFVASSMQLIADGKARIPLHKIRVFRLIFRNSDERNAEHRLFISKFFVLSCLFYVVWFGHLPFRREAEMGFPDMYPKHAVEYLRQAKNSGVILATPDWGGFLTWSLWPHSQVVIDDRNTLLGEQRYRKFYALRDVTPGWEELLERNEIRYLLFSPEDRVVEKLRKLPDWKIVEQGSDSVAILFERVLP